MQQHTFSLGTGRAELALAGMSQNPFRIRFKLSISGVPLDELAYVEIHPDYTEVVAPIEGLRKRNERTFTTTAIPPAAGTVEGELWQALLDAAQKELTERYEKWSRAAWWHKSGELACHAANIAACQQGRLHTVVFPGGGQ